MKKKYVKRFPVDKRPSIKKRFEDMYEWFPTGWDWNDLTLWGKIYECTKAALEFPFAMIVLPTRWAIDRIHEMRSARIEEKRTYIDGKLEGEARTYWPNGRLREIAHYHEGELEGVRQTYYENGRLESSCSYREGKEEGVCERYYESGDLMQRYNYRDGKIEGALKSYYESGQLQMECTYRNDKKEGLELQYHENGKLMGELFFTDGKIDGPYKTYSSDGKLLTSRVLRKDESLSGQEAEDYLKEWENRQMEENPQWRAIKDKLAHLTDDVYFAPIKPARTPERTEKAKRIIEVRRGAEILASAMKDAKKAKDRTLLTALRKLAHPFAEKEMSQRRAFSRIRELRKLRRKQK